MIRLLDLFAEARSLYSRGILEFTHEDDLALLKETHLGHFGILNDERVPLDFPIEIDEAYEVNGKRIPADLTIAGKKVKAIHHNDSKNVEDHEIEYEDGTREPYMKHIINEVIKENKMPSQEEVDKFFSITQNETHYLNSKPVKGQKGDRVRSEIEPWDEYDLSNYRSLVRKYKEGRPSVSENKKKKKGHAFHRKKS